jgi:hypothetical protein
MNSKESNASAKDRALPPTRLYKYEPLNAQSLKNLKAQTIYFGSPSNFNDPYDCTLAPNIDAELSTSDINKFREKWSAAATSSELANFCMNADESLIREMALRSAKEAIAEAQQNFPRRGVSCFSEVNNDLLMWAHYADKYKGFCLEFDTSEELFAKALKVQYQKTMPTLDLASLLIHEKFDLVMSLFSTKSPSWQYEKEWRVIHGTAGTSVTYPAECLTGVYLGPEIDFESLEIICLILQSQNPHVKFWKGTRSKTEFKVDFEQVTYTSFLAALDAAKND